MSKKRKKKGHLGNYRRYPQTRSHLWTWPLRVTIKNVLDSLPLGSTTPCSMPTTVVSTLNMLGGDTVTYGELVPDWRKRIASGSSATTSLDGTKYHVKAPFGSASWENTTVRCTRSTSAYGQFTGMKLTFNNPGAAGDPTAESRAKSSLLGNCIKAKTSWRGGNFFAELGEAYHMIRHPLQSFYNHTWDFAGRVKKLGKVYARKPPAYADALANAWLAFSFGAKPLISDIDDAADALNRLTAGFNFDDLPIKGHGHSTQVLSQGDTNMIFGGWAGDVYSSFVTVKSDFDVRYKGTLRAGLDNGSRYFDHFGLSLDDYVPAVWEAIPWSFLIDYFTNTGEQLDSLRFGKVAIGWLKHTVRNSGVVQARPPVLTSKAPGYTTSMSCGTAHSLCVRTTRTPVLELPLPDWHFKVPGIDSLKWLNIAALVQQIKDSKPKW